MAAAFVLDRASILERLGGDEEIYTMMVDMFVADVENNCTTLATAHATGDVEALKRAAHTVKGLLTTFSDEDGAAEAHFVEKNVRADQLTMLAAAVADIQSRLREAAAVLRAGQA